MNEDFCTKKFTHHFNMFDYNGNGVLEESDLLLPIERLSKTHGLDPNSEDMATYLAILQQMSALLVQVADEDNDGVIGLKEYVKCCLGIAAGFRAGDEQVAATFQAWAVATGNMLDASNDGRVTWEEYDGFIRAFHDDMYFDTKAAFAILDLDGDGVISIPEEITQITQDFFLSDDPTAPGNWLFGPIPGTIVTLPAE